MTAPNVATLWGETIVAELVASGVDAVCVAPGSRSTPLTVAAARHDDLTVYSHLDERSGSFFALGRAKRTGSPTAIVTTSGTAAAELHAAIVEADASRVPILALTADRPAELQDSGANQTIDQTDLYGDAVRWQRTLPEPAAGRRRLRSLRTTVCRAVAVTTGPNPGPVHLNVPLAKPLAPIEGAPGEHEGVPGERVGVAADSPPVGADSSRVPDDLVPSGVPAASERDGPYVASRSGTPTLSATDATAIATVLEDADRPLVVVGPATGGELPAADVAELADAVDAPVLADPLSGVRFGQHVPGAPICGGYDGFLAGADDWPDPDAVLRFGASPTSKRLRHWLRDADCRQIVVDPAGGWPEAEFTATDRVVAAPDSVVAALREADPAAGLADWRERFERAERTHWETVDPALASETFEGSVARTVLDHLPEPATCFVSNSMPVRDVDRFAPPDDADRTVLGNRGASGIDGIVSSALGAGADVDEPLVALVGDLALYHDANGLLAADRCDAPGTIVCVHNDGGGIFHELPIADVDPPFTEQFLTPHGLDFEGLGTVYDLAVETIDDREMLADRLTATVGDGTPRLFVVRVDGAASHERRADLDDAVAAAVEE